MSRLSCFGIRAEAAAHVTLGAPIEMTAPEMKALEMTALEMTRLELAVPSRFLAHSQPLKQAALIKQP